MKKFKKLLTTLLSTAMVASMVVIPAMADDAQGETPAATTEETNATPSSDSIDAVTFDKYFVSETGSVLPDETFTFTMTPATVELLADAEGQKTVTPTTATGLQIVSGVSLGNNATTTLTFDANNTKITTKDEDKIDNLYTEKLTGSFSLAGVTWGTEPKVYRYTVQETAGSNTAITYDSSVFTVDVYTNNEGKAVYAVCGDVDKTTQQMKTGENDKKVLQFVNRSKTDVLEITKKVTGALGSKTKQFAFSIDIPVEGSKIDLAEGKTFKGTFTRAANSTAADTTEITITVGTPATFTLADGETLKIEGVPENMIYVITEDADDSADYTTTIAGETTVVNGNSSSTVTKDVNGKVFDAHTDKDNMPIVNGGNKVIFTNDRDTTPTGLVLEYAPYLMGMLIVIIGAVLVLVSRKRKSAR
jgi:hypothetical protein